MTFSPDNNFPTADSVMETVEGIARSWQPLAEQLIGVLGRTADAIANIPFIHWATGIPGMAWVLAALGQVNIEKVQQDVAALRHQYPLETPDQLAQRIVRTTTWEGAQVGLATNLIPSVALTLFAIDLGAIAALQAQMIYRIAAVYGFSPDNSDRRGEVLALWLVSSSSSNMIKAGLHFPEALPLIGAAIGVATDASLIYTVGLFASRFYGAKQHRLPAV
jgi:uncharacterized protein (DUF697 family)